MVELFQWLDFRVDFTQWKESYQPEQNPLIFHDAYEELNSPEIVQNSTQVMLFYSLYSSNN